MAFNPEDTKSDKTKKYTFRTTPKLFNDLKNYANAKNTTIPTIINEYFEELLKDKTLSREENTNFTIPFYALSHVDDQIAESSKLFKKHENKWYQHMGYVFYNNCLDVWKDDTYKSDNPDMKHEGLAILRETIPQNDSLKTSEMVYFVKIEHKLDDSIFSYVIEGNFALNLAEKVKNYILIEKIKKNLPIVEKLHQNIEKILKTKKISYNEEHPLLKDRRPDIMKENRLLRSEKRRLEKELEKYKNPEMSDI